VKALTVVQGLDLDQWTERRLLVVGDLMLDEYLWGRVERISPEAPVPVVEVSREEAVLGGAGNVVRNLRALGAQVSVAGMVGDDPAGRRVLELLAEAGANGSEVLVLEGRRTSLKSRLMAGHQQVVRIDRETRAEIEPVQAGALVASIAKRINDFDGLILSDYAKGVLSPGLLGQLIPAFQKVGRPVVVDPKSRPYRDYAGASLLTPNQREARQALGLDLSRPEEAAHQAARLLAEHDWSGLLVTRGSQGLSLFRPGREPVHVAAQARQVFDVSGAGDTVAAVAGLGLACGWPMEAVARLANLAGGVVVGKVGTAALSREELARAGQPQGDGKILGLEELYAATDRLKALGKRIVFTNGCFDLLHTGHLHFLQRSKEEGEVLIVGLDDDASVARLKGPGRPVISQSERARIMAALDFVDFVFVFETGSLEKMLRRLSPDVLTKGANYGPDQVVGRSIVEAAGGRVVLIPLEGGETTSSRLNRLRQPGE